MGETLGSRIPALLLLVVIVSVFLVNPWATQSAFGQDGVITAVDPPSLMQGDTVLLTITGQGLPTGSITVEFYPQQIALIDVLSSSETEILAQIKVFSLAPTGKYNILVYNHIGEDAFGEGLLEIYSDVLTPVFRDYSPKTIADAGGGFALLLTGEAITPAAMDHLDVEWQQNAKLLTNLNTSFSLGAQGTVVCAVTGEPPGGVLRGRVLLDGKPIYMLEVSIKAFAPTIVGHTPSELVASEPPYVVTVIGSDFVAAFLDELEITLQREEMLVATGVKTSSDSASVVAEFGEVLAPGEYQLVVQSNDGLLYRSELSIVASTPTVPPPVEPSSPPEIKPQVEPSTPPELPPATGIAQVDVQGSLSRLPAPLITEVQPVSVSLSSSRFRLAVAGAELTPEIIGRLELAVSAGSSQCELLFVGATNNGFTCVFSAPGSAGGQPENGELVISDPAGEMETFTQILDFEYPEKPPEPAPLSQIPVEGWEVRSAQFSTTNGVGMLSVTLDSPEVRLDPALLQGGFTLIPAEPEINTHFNNLTLEGVLSFKRTTSGAVIGTFAGNLPTGDLLIELNYDAGIPQLVTIPLDSGLPRAKLVPPPIERLRLDAESGALQPASLRWVVDFSPLVVNSSEFLAIEWQPPTAEAETGVSTTIEGTQVVIEQDLNAWQGVEDGWQQGLVLALDSAIPLHWESPQQIAIEVEKVQTPWGGLSVTLAEKQARIDEDGFEVTLIPAGPMPPLAAFKQVTLSSGQLLLSRNIEKFEVFAASTQVRENPAVILSFKRDREALPDIAYEMLVDELVSATAVQLEFNWEELNIMLSDEVQFIERAGLPLDDLLEELGSGSG